MFYFLNNCDISVSQNIFAHIIRSCCIKIHANESYGA